MEVGHGDAPLVWVLPRAWASRRNVRHGGRCLVIFSESVQILPLLAIS